MFLQLLSLSFLAEGAPLGAMLSRRLAQTARGQWGGVGGCPPSAAPKTAEIAAGQWRAVRLSLPLLLCCPLPLGLGLAWRHQPQWRSVQLAAVERQAWHENQLNRASFGAV